MSLAFYDERTLKHAVFAVQSGEEHFDWLNSPPISKNRPSPLKNSKLLAGAVREHFFVFSPTDTLLNFLD